jgi:phenylacetate-CoA ligase
MVFQYNPLIHYMQVNAEAEVICTVSRLDLLSPRIRYNVHDSGGIMPFGTARGLLRQCGFDIDRLGEAPEVHGPRGPLSWARPIPLPFLWIYGRRDATISVMGSNIYPEDIESIVYGDRELLRKVHSFMLSVVDDDAGTPRPLVALELNDLEGVDGAWEARTAQQLRDGLTALNIDYRTSVVEFPEAMLPIVSAYPRGGGAFAGDVTRIKQRRIL